MNISIDVEEELLKAIELVHGRTRADTMRRLIQAVRERASRFRIATEEEKEERGFSELGKVILGLDNWYCQSSYFESAAIDKLNELLKENRELKDRIERIKKI